MGLTYSIIQIDKVISAETYYTSQDVEDLIDTAYFNETLTLKNFDKNFYRSFGVNFESVIDRPDCSTLTLVVEMWTENTMRPGTVYKLDTIFIPMTMSTYNSWICEFFI